MNTGDALSAVPPYVCSWWRVLQRKEQDVQAAAQLLGTNNGSRRPRLTRKTLAMHCSRTWNTHTVHWRASLGPSSVKPRTTRTVVQLERYSLPRKPHVHERASCRPAPSRDPQGCVGPVPHRPVRNGPACCNAWRTRHRPQYGAMTELWFKGQASCPPADVPPRDLQDSKLLAIEECMSGHD